MSFRKFKAVNVSELKSDIAESFQSVDSDCTVVELVEQYQRNLSNIIDIHAPLTTKSILLRPNTQWYSCDLRDAKREKRKAERNGVIRNWKFIVRSFRISVGLLVNYYTKQKKHITPLKLKTVDTITNSSLD